jgi:NAD(P)-dependent dehydrogenase (short-subunit alcohol dehydrogenase family)
MSQADPAKPHFDVLAGKTCLVTGGSRTLGAEIVRQMARHGVRVAVNYHRSAEAALALCTEIAAHSAEVSAFHADVTDEGDVAQLVTEVSKQFGPIDILVNNVGPYVDGPFLDMPLADFDRILAGNVRSTFLLSQTVGRQMKARGNGHIINIAATDVFHRSHSIYGLAKSGVIHLTEAMALELAPGVRVNAIAPDLIADNEDMTPEFTGQAIAGTPLARLVTRSEIANMVCLLCTPAFAMVTGQTIVMDGGRTIPRISNVQGYS